LILAASCCSPGGSIHFLGYDGELNQSVRSEGRDYRNVSSVASPGNKDAPNAGAIVPRIEGKPSAT
jgi:hypothetical protein